MLSIGVGSLRASGLSFVLFGFYTVYSSLYLALGKAAKGFFLGACRQGICFVPIILILPVCVGKGGIIYAQPIADILSVLAAAFAAAEIHKELNAAKRG